jgi:hypothetical protein
MNGRGPVMKLSEMQILSERPGVGTRIYRKEEVRTRSRDDAWLSCSKEKAIKYIYTSTPLLKVINRRGYIIYFGTCPNYLELPNERVCHFYYKGPTTLHPLYFVRQYRYIALISILTVNIQSQPIYSTWAAKIQNLGPSNLECSIHSNFHPNIFWLFSS